MAKITPLRSEPKFQNFLRTYSQDWSLACRVLFGLILSAQQDLVVESVNKKSSRTTVASGHGTGKSILAAAMIIIFMIMYPKARVVIVANKIQQVKDAIWKYLKVNYAEMEKRVPWLAQYFIITETELYERTSKGVHFVTAKGFKPNQEDSLAGEHADYMLTIIDEASGFNNKAFKVIMGAQTSYDNRVLLLSQPLRLSGAFYDTHHSLSIHQGGKWIPITLNSMYAPWVDSDWVREHLIMYGGVDDPEFQIKVMGRFPKNINDLLLARAEAEAATKAKPQLDDDWGWLICCDVGAGRDRSVLNIVKVSGEKGRFRKVVTHKIREQKADLKTLDFARLVIAEIASGEYPNMTIVIDGGGVGIPVVEFLLEELERQDLGDTPVQIINWGKKPFTKVLQQRFVSERAMAHIYFRDAVKSGRHKLDSHKKTLEQASRLPCFLNDHGQWKIMDKSEMREKMQIPSPDRTDTHCFAHLANYIPHNQESLVIGAGEDGVNEFDKYLEEESE